MTPRRRFYLLALLLSFVAEVLVAEVLVAEVPGTSSEPAEVPGTSGDTSRDSSSVDWQPYRGKTFDGRPLDGELGRITVPERWDRPAGKTFELAFVRFRTTHPDPGPPIFFLAGGPGGSGVELSALVATHPQIRLLEHSDVIGVEQRGTGLSRPDLMQSVLVQTLPLDRAVSRADFLEALRKVVEGTVEHWRRQGVDLAAYNSRESADDLEAVRRALGYEQIMLYGTSYGSHLGLAYLRQHQGHVARAVLTKVEGPNHTFKLPGTVERHLEQVHRWAADDPALDGRMPDLLGLLRRLLKRLAVDPVTVAGEPGSGEEPVTIGPLDLQIEVSRALASADSIAALPASLHRFAAGDWSQLAATARENRQIDLPAMALMMDCASGATDERWQQIRRQLADPSNLLGDAIMAPFYPAACQAAGSPDLGDDFRGPFVSQVPILFVSGTLDVRTPPENVEELLAGFENAVHVVVENTGHEARELMSPEYRDLLQAFLRGEKVESCRIVLPAPIFEPLDGT